MPDIIEIGHYYVVCDKNNVHFNRIGMNIEEKLNLLIHEHKVTLLFDGNFKETFNATELRYYGERNVEIKD